MSPSKKRRSRSLHSHINDLRGASRLAVEATQGICDLVQAMHETIASGPVVLGRPLERPTRVINGIVYPCIRRVTRLVGTGIDRALAQLTFLLGPDKGQPQTSSENAIRAVLNGVLGDYLVETHNPLAISMRLRRGETPLGLQPRKLLVLVHGSCLTDHHWLRHQHDHGQALSHDLGYTPVYLHYNTGLHISTNGRLFAATLEDLVSNWPAPLDEIVILAHSMGGLVSRSACRIAEEEKYNWRKKLRSMIFLGTPHHGAPLERGGNWFEYLLGVSRYSAPLARLGKIRSAGVTDMRHGSVLDEHWRGKDRFARGKDTRTPLSLPQDVKCYAIAASKGLTKKGKFRSDGIVPVESALGQCKNDKLTLAFPDSHQWVGKGMTHLDLLNRPEVYEKIREWLTSPNSETLSN